MNGLSVYVQSNGLDERFNQTLQQMMMKVVKERKDAWEDFIDTCVYAYNTAVHESTGFTPFELMFGRKTILPIDIEIDGHDPETLQQPLMMDTQVLTDITNNRQNNLQVAHINIKKAQEKQKLTYDRKHARPNAFCIGDKVLKKENVIVSH